MRQWQYISICNLTGLTFDVHLFRFLLLRYIYVSNNSFLFYLDLIEKVMLIDAIPFIIFSQDLDVMFCTSICVDSRSR
jgi:hypothetical protein